MDKSAPSKESLERAQKWLKAVSHQHDWTLCSGCAASLALEFDAIALESERNVCEILRGENSSNAAREPLRISDAMDSYKGAIARERDEVTEKLAKVVNTHYPTIAGRVIQLQEAGEEKAAAEWNKVATAFYAAITAYRERMGRK